MKTLTRNLISSLFFASVLVGFQAQAEIQTITMGRGVQTLPPDNLKRFSGETPCNIKWADKFPTVYAGVAKSFREGGFNITSDGNADCTIEITGYVTVPSTTSGSVPINLVYALDKANILKDIGPALPTTNSTDAVNIANNASGMTSVPVGSTGFNLLSQAGGAMDGLHGSVTGAALGVLANLVNLVQTRQETPSGIVYINAVVIFRVGSLFGTPVTRPTIVLGVYAASTTPEQPIVLADSALKRLAKLIWEHVEEYDKKNNIAFTAPSLIASTSIAPAAAAASSVAAIEPISTATPSTDNKIVAAEGAHAAETVK